MSSFTIDKDLFAYKLRKHFENKFQELMEPFHYESHNFDSIINILMRGDSNTYEEEEEAEINEELKRKENIQREVWHNIKAFLIQMDDVVHRASDLNLIDVHSHQIRELLKLKNNIYIEEMRTKFYQ